MTDPDPISWQAAKAAGLRHYFTGAPCAYGHVAWRMVANRTCAECLRLRAVADYWRDPEPRRELAKFYGKKWKTENRARHHASVREWRAANPDRVLVYTRVDVQRRRAALRRAGPSDFTTADLRHLLTAQRGCCALCRRKLGRAFHIDHIAPLSRGGAHHRRNIQLLCPPCNLSKSAKDPIDFAREMGLLL